MVARNYSPPHDYAPSVANPMLSKVFGTGSRAGAPPQGGPSALLTRLARDGGLCACALPRVGTDPLVGAQRTIVPFLACGDLSGFDTDATRPLEVCAPPGGRMRSWLPGPV